MDGRKLRNGSSALLDLSLGERELFARRHADHQFHQVQARDAFRHRVLHLQAGVHLQEIEVLVLADDKLHRARALVFHSLGQLHGLLAHGLAGGFADEGAGRLFDHLLVAALDGALALVQVNDVAVAVAHHLDFDVARLLYKLLDEDAVVAKAVARLVLAGGKALERFLVVEGHAQALATTAGRGLDHHGIANALGDLHRLFGTGNRVVVAGNGVDLGLVGQLLGRNLVAHGRNGVRLGADEGNALVLAALGKGLVLAQEAIAGVHSLGTGLLAGLNDLVGQQIALAAGRGANAHGLVSQLDVAGFLVGVGIDSDGGNAHLAGGSNHPTRNFATVRNQDFCKHSIDSSGDGVACSSPLRGLRQALCRNVRCATVLLRLAMGQNATVGDQDFGEHV